MEDQEYRKIFADNGLIFEDDDFEILQQEEGLSDFFDIFSEYFESCYLSFDGECIEDENAYAGLLSTFTSITDGHLKIENITSAYDESSQIEKIQFDMNDKRIEWRCSHDSDWVSDEFIEKVRGLAIIDGFGQFLIDQRDDFYTSIYVKNELANFITEYNDEDDTEIECSEGSEHYPLPEKISDYDLDSMSNDFYALASTAVGGDVVSVRVSLELDCGELGIGGSVEYQLNGGNSKNVRVSKLGIPWNLFVGFYVALANENHRKKYVIDFEPNIQSSYKMEVDAYGGSWEGGTLSGMTLDSFVEKNREYSKADVCFDELTVKANDGHVESQFELGYLYHKGMGVDEDQLKALDWFLSAAKQDHAKAAYLVSNIHYFKEIPESKKDLGLANRMLIKSAEFGHTDAQTKLGTYYAEAKSGFEKDIIESLKWYQLAADSGNEIAQYGLGGLHASKTVEFPDKDVVLGYAWTKLSANNGFSMAGIVVGFISDSLTEEQLERGELLVEALSK
ncbi:MAG: sel1 repeat family protein [Pseudomonadales bacterium]|nr:sel1 repeat family protein [Pseudomonadales bacterium]